MAGAEAVTPRFFGSERTASENFGGAVVCRSLAPGLAWAGYDYLTTKDLSLRKAVLTQKYNGYLVFETEKSETVPIRCTSTELALLHEGTEYFNILYVSRGLTGENYLTFLIPPNL